MSATMVIQGGRVQLEQSDMRLAVNMATMAKPGFPRAAMGETQQEITKPRCEFRADKKRGVEVHGHQTVKAAIERHQAMVYNNQIHCCLPCQNGTAKNPQTRWRCKGTAAHPPKPAAPLHGRPPPTGMPHAPPGDSDGQQSNETDAIPPLCVYTQSLCPNTAFFNHNAYDKDSKHDCDFNPDLRSTLSAMWKYR